MKSSFFSLFALTGLLASSCVASPALDAVAIEKRQNNAALSIVTDLLSTIQGFDATINTTVASVTSSSSVAAQRAASAIVNEAVASITTAVNDAVAAVRAIQVTAKRDGLVTRQTATPAAITAVLEEILEELSNTLNGVIGTLGLTSLLGFLAPLTTALNQLIAALEATVDGLLGVVEGLLGGILSGLSVALAGLVL